MASTKKQPQPEASGYDSNPEVKALTAQSTTLAEKARTLIVTTNEQYESAAFELQAIKGAKDRLEKLRKTFTAPLDQAKKAIMDFFRGPTEQLDAAEFRYKRAMVVYSDEQARKQRDEQARADEAARKERERIAELARKAAQAGKLEKAEALQQKSAAVVAPVIQCEAPKVTGIATREQWKFEVTDAALLPREHTLPNMTSIGGVVRALKGNTSIPGVRVWSENAIAGSKGAA